MVLPQFQGCEFYPRIGYENFIGSFGVCGLYAVPFALAQLKKKQAKNKNKQTNKNIMMLYFKRLILSQKT